MPKQIIEKIVLYGPNNDGNPRRYTVADGTQISKGVLLELSDPQTAAAMSGGVTAAATKWCAGIAAMEKEASDGSTTISAWTQGEFDAIASGAIPVGNAVVAVVDGYIKAADVAHAASGAVIIGYALETASDAERISFRLNL